MSRIPRWLVAVLVLEPALAFAQNDQMHFSKGSLIIPLQGNYQTDCGTASAYGLVWRILQSNQAGHYNASHPVTVYWVINGTKLSPNRCVPNNKVSPPAPFSVGPSGNSNGWDDPKWNDGCDASIVNTAQQPVVPVDYTKAWPSSSNGMYANGAIPVYKTVRDVNTDSCRTCSEASPPFATPSTPLDNSGTGNARFTAIQYQGGPFVISAQDAPNVIGFLKSGDSSVPVGTGASGALSRFTTPCTCNFNGSTACNYVNMHQATIDFTAYVGRRINKVPPKIALLNSGSGVSTGILNQYLANAGLLVTGTSNYQDSAGCPEGTFASCTLNGGKPGLIYDQFNANADLISTASSPYGLLNATDSTGKLRYAVFWTPHWVAADSSYSQYVPNGDGATSQRQNAMNNIAHFADQVGTGLMAECASLESYEGSLQAGSNFSCVRHCVGGTRNGRTCTYDSYCIGGTCAAATCSGGDNLGDACTSSSDCPSTTSLVPVYSTLTHFQFTNEIVVNGLTHDETAWDARNCTDPDYLAITPASSRGMCTFYPNPGDPFSQMGDYHFTATSGHVHQYRPYSGNSSTYRNGIRRLAVSWENATGPDDYAGPQIGNNGWDFISLGYKDNDSNKATVLYLAGHDYSGNIAGNRIVLNTLMNLGADPISSERALAAPVAYDDPNGSDASGNAALIIDGTYMAVTGYGPGAQVFDPVMGGQWMFPYTPGHLRAHSLIGGTALAAGSNSLDAATLWDADAKMPAPGARNLFTYFGGELQESPSLSKVYVLGAGSASTTATAVGNAAPHSVLQVGWKAQKIAADAINNSYGSAPNASCVDELKLGEVATPAGGSAFGFLKGADGVCDLQEALEVTSLNAGDDYGANELAANKALFAADFSTVQRLIQKVRGYCWASNSDGTPNLTPSSPSACADPKADNKAHLGGIVHSTPAVIPASPRIPEADGKARPTVAYVGALDGQLHAIYVSGGSGYTGPASPLHFLNPDASSTFSTNYAASFASSNPPPAGTELWSYLPASQLPFLRGNSAKIDSSPVVEDVFVDLTGSGIREWHTVLVSSLGGHGREVFALDITNPLKPVLLWDLAGSVASSGGYPKFAANLLANSSIGGTDYTYKFDNRTSIFALPPTADEGRAASGLYDYSDLGGGSGISVAQLREGLDPVYAVFVATNASGVNGVSKAVEVFAIDVATGQKLWQWEEPYKSSWSDNTVPPVATMFKITPNAPRIYVPDMEGALWELDARTGQNLNYRTDVPGCSTSSPCRLALFDATPTCDDTECASPEPLTTNVGVVKVPAAVEDGSVFKGYEGTRLLVVGTAGADWVSSAVKGHLHMLLLDDPYRKPILAGGKHLDGSAWEQTDALASAQTDGLLQEPSPFALEMAAGERLYGAISASGKQVFFETARGAIGDIMKLDGMMKGATNSINLGNADQDAPAVAFPAVAANFGGVTVLHRASVTASTDYIVATAVSQLDNNVVVNTTISGAATADRSLRPEDSRTGALLRIMGWLRRTLE
jgi:type IV pilus assembly protein PilY1